MRVFSSLALFLVLFIPWQAAAKDLPKAEYVLLGEVLPGIQDGIIVPVFVHLQTDKDQMNWNFITVFVPDKLMCDDFGNCNQVEPALSHKVRWKEDGDLQVLSTDRRTGHGKVIDRAEIDASQIINPIDSLVQNGTLTLGDQGGTFKLLRRGKSPKVVDLQPVSLEDLLAAISLVKGFNLSFADLNQCAVRQVVAIMGKADRSEAEQQVVDAARFLGRYDRLDGEGRYYPFREAPEDQREEVGLKSLHSSAMQVGLRIPLRDVTDALLNGTPMSDEDVLAQSAEIIARLEKSAGAYYQTIREDILVTHRTQLLAAIRLSARFSALQAKGHELQQAVCSDITLMQ